MAKGCRRSSCLLSSCEERVLVPNDLKTSWFAPEMDFVFFVRVWVMLSKRESDPKPEGIPPGIRILLNFPTSFIGAVLSSRSDYTLCNGPQAARWLRGVRSLLRVNLLRRGLFDDEGEGVARRRMEEDANLRTGVPMVRGSRRRLFCDSGGQDFVRMRSNAV